MSETWRKSHNISILIYHFVCPAKYRKVVFNDEVDELLKNRCLEIEKRYEIKFIAKQNTERLAASVNALRWLTFLDLRNAPAACNGDSKSKATGLLGKGEQWVSLFKKVLTFHVKAL